MQNPSGKRNRFMQNPSGKRNRLARMLQSGGPTATRQGGERIELRFFTRLSTIFGGAPRVPRAATLT